MRLNADDVRHLRTGALFLACAADPEWCDEQQDRILARMSAGDGGPELIEVGELDGDALVAAVGFVNNGLPLSELRPAGDEFVTSVELLERELGQRIEGLFPLAAANVNSMVPLLTGMQLGRPTVDADPMGRVFPLLFQSVFTLAGLPAGPLAATGPVGESAVLRVREPRRAERLVRALAEEFGGWSATALYPMTARDLARTGVLGSVSRMVRIGRILDSALPVAEKHELLRRTEGVRRIIRARVADVAGLSRPAPAGEPDHPSSVVLIEETQGRFVQLEIQNELLMLMVDGTPEAVIPDIITMLHPEDGRVASLDDLWAGNTLDLVVLPAAAQWYTPEGRRLAAPETMHAVLPDRRRSRA
ncbi:DUF917 domain-containing protein [Microbacterium azadirachtae]|uniref:DUF917 domain-containing protein n=1 Tax=Microbacterium azadirachtae TaxID=582680 RepID=A0A0F0LL60_9MICO|nr:DUF917 domain-containing protein [Microbacterium azadirachtae]KJL33883.1 hypothetical protein RS86_01319 [Microbacterium azadirachtae]